MKRVLLVLALALAPAFAAEEGGHGGGMKEPSIWWKWANFAVLAGGLGYLISKYAPAYFESRNKEIRGGLQEARKLREESEARVADIERRVARLGTDMDAMREGAKKEMAAEAERIRTETEKTLAKVQANAEHEIAAATKFALHDLKVYSADLAIQLAAAHVRNQLNPATQDKLVTDFVGQLAAAKKVSH
ncbi:MAG: ATP synthase F0 subunit B [Bryobacterales bacterium]|nr:ATP synthase F0 subunit B [Bryobacterales bacterium]